jgi:hypothetical protein
MSSLNLAELSMKGMKPMSQGLLPPLVTWLWLVALAAVLVLHCGHLVRMGGQHRWYHASHILMLVSMLYMYASMEFRWKWFPASSWVAIFTVSTVAIAAWMVIRLVQRRPFSLLWALALVMQAAMAYMWMPDWAPALTWFLVIYYAVETAAWLSGALDDTGPSTAAGPEEPPVGPKGHEQVTTGGNVGVLSRSLAAGQVHRPGAVALARDSAADRVAMAVMAASMAYMFAAMQLMR